jgi:dihydrofolate reductase
MAASLDGFVARMDGSVDWLETADEFMAGATLDGADVAAFLQTIDCYVMGARTYETALRFADQGAGWAYGDTPTIVLTARTLRRHHASVEFYAGDLAPLVNDRLRRVYRNIWVAGGPETVAAFLRQGLVDEIRYTVLPIAIGAGLPFFAPSDQDVALHVVEVTAYRNGMVELRYEVRSRPAGEPRAP